jgi:hypothetical protein
MTVGRNEEALALFEKIYSCNTGKNKEDFPVRIFDFFKFPLSVLF